MMSQAVWGPLKVKDFFRDFNWLGEPVKLEPLESDQDQLSQTSWMCLRVADFLSQSNWRGTKLAQAPVQSFPETENLVLTMSVNKFFRLAQWRSTPTATAVKEIKTSPEPIAQETEEMNVTDLSDLF
jgi:hypothetical protein